jgi:hypothetical protein
MPNPLRDTAYMWIPAGALDGDGPLRIGAQVFLDSRAAWDTEPGAGAPQSRAPDLHSFIAYLHGETRQGG